MYVVYHGSSSTILPAIAAALHLNQLAMPCHSFEGLEAYFKVMNRARGRLVFIGKDHENNQIYVLNTVSSSSIILPALTSVFQMLQINEGLLLLADTSGISNFYLCLSPWLNRLGLRHFSHRVLLRGLSSETDKILKISNIVRGRLKN